MLYLIPILSFLGILVGLFLRKVDRDEIILGRYGPRYFVWLKRIILSLTIIISLLFTESILLVIITIIIGFILAILVNEYLFLGVALTLGFIIGSNILLIMATLVFLYGLPFGSLTRKLRLNHVWFLIFFLPFILLFVDTNINILTGIASGGCFNHLIRK